MGVPLHLLVIEDSSDDAQLMIREIQHGGFEVEYERVESEAALRNALANEQWDVILCDYTLPAFNAIRALEIVKASGLDLPFIILSGSIGEEMAVAALRGGANDFMLKGNLARLLPAIRRELAEAETRRERSRAEAGLREAEARYRTLVEQLPMIVYIGSAQDASRTLYVSPQIEAVLGYTQHAWLEDPLYWLSAVHEDDRPRVLEQLERTNRSQEPFDVDYRMRRRDGKVLWVRDQSAPVRSPGGELLYWQGFMVDITEAKQREREWEAIARLSNALRETQTVHEILPRLLDETLALLGAEGGSVWLHDAAGDGLRLGAQRGWGGDASGRSQLVPEIPSEALAAGQPAILQGPGAGAAVPLTAAGKRLGSMLVQAQPPREINAGELRVLSALADLGAYAIHRAQLFEETIRHMDQLAALRSIDIAISSSFDLGMILSVVLEKVTSGLRVDAADVLLLKADSLLLEYTAGKGFQRPHAETFPLQVGQGLPGNAILKRDITHVEDLREVPAGVARPDLLSEEKFVSYYCVPLVAKGKVKGVLEVFHRAPLHGDAEWLKFLEALAGQAAIAIDSSSTFQDLQRSNMELALAYDATIQGWSHALDLRDKETEGHTLRVTEMALKLARSMGVTEEMLVQMRRGGLLHDIGKMGVPDSILLKPGRLNDEEWAIMRQHPQFAYDMLASIPYLRPALDIPYCHHERWDGHGYPRGLKGLEIPFAARIFAIVDVWDALRRGRPYRAARTPEQVREYLRRESGKHFDPAVTEAFLQLLASEP